MKEIRTYLICLFLIFFLSPNMDAQETLIPLGRNPEAMDYYKKFPAGKKATDADTVDLPFIDDFSNSYIRPEPGLWSDFNVYVNNNYPVYPVSAGVATFDALKYDGSQYPDAGVYPYKADYLTSNPVDLDYPASDSIYLSFYYQPEGKGEMPDPEDSLCLDFFDTQQEVWNRIWAVPGTSLHPFKRVMIPITDPRYLKEGFRFRFFNYASQTKNNDYYDKRANVDHWNVDYIKLDRLRSISDTILRDVSFVNSLQSILKNYTSIPWDHFPQAYALERTPYIRIVLVNHDYINRNVTRYLEITDLQTNEVSKSVPTASDIPSGDSIHFAYPYDYSFEQTNPDSASFLIKTYIRTDAFDYKPNDTLIYTQKFKNYYAYDDGSAEVGYGLRGSNSQNASVAIRFNSYKPDSLRAVDMYFNQVLDSVNLNYYFYLKIWEDNNGEPGKLLYSQLGVKPEYSSQLNKFRRYELDSAVYVDGNFFVGWTKTVDKMLNIGMDRNRNSSSSIFYNLDGSWQNTKFEGSIMLRPVLSSDPLNTATEEKSYENPIDHFKVYPNPADAYIHLEVKDQDLSSYSLYIMDATGRQVDVVHPSYRNAINVSGLKNGIYFILLVNNSNGKNYTQKIIIHH